MIPPAIVTALLLALVGYECTSGWVHVRKALHLPASRVDSFPVHHEPLSTDTGHHYFFGTMVAKGGCLRLDYSNSFAYDYYILLVWPAGYVLDTTEGNILVRDTTGHPVAHPGDNVRLSGHFIGDAEGEYSSIFYRMDRDDGRQ